ncbi:MAG: glycosyl hydrolase family 28-related protein [Chitinivibrionales bacterium]|nr:glycosyl hydrolase family 28-related protein [Chitinivibrionales bacterium]
MYDAVRDFGAIPNGSADQSAKIQNCINAAVNSTSAVAMAYLPAGAYKVGTTLTVNNTSASRKIILGGAGMLSTSLGWTGSAGGTILSITNPQNVVVQDLRAGEDTDPCGNDIYVTGTTGNPSITFDGVFTGTPGLFVNGMCSGGVVHMRHLHANCYFSDCADATILGSWVSAADGNPVPASDFVADLTKPSNRGGFFGIMFLLFGHDGVPAQVNIKNNLSFVAEVYSENAVEIFKFEGGPTDPPGRISIQGEKLHCEEVATAGMDGLRGLETDGYAGQIVISSAALANTVSPWTVGKILLQGTYGAQDMLFIACTMASGITPTISGNAHCYKLALSNHGGQCGPGDLSDNFTSAQYTVAAHSLDDWRKLGAIDLALNYGFNQTVTTASKLSLTQRGLLSPVLSGVYNPKNKTLRVALTGFTDASSVSFTIYDICGRHIQSLVSEKINASAVGAQWDMKNDKNGKSAKGFYLLRAVAGGKVFEQKVFTR